MLATLAHTHVFCCPQAQAAKNWHSPTCHGRCHHAAPSQWARCETWCCTMSRYERPAQGDNALCAAVIGGCRGETRAYSSDPALRSSLICFCCNCTVYPNITTLTTDCMLVPAAPVAPTVCGGHQEACAEGADALASRQVHGTPGAAPGGCRRGACVSTSQGGVSSLDAAHVYVMGALL